MSELPKRAQAVQSILFQGFGVSGSLTKTVIHFFAVEGGMTAPYAAKCTLRVFGEGIEDKKIMLDGVRLSHPDGVRLQDAFPEVREAGLVGIEVELATQQPRVDISASQVVVEFAGQGYSCRYRLPQKGARKEGGASALVVKEPHLLSSVVLVNGGDVSLTESCSYNGKSLSGEPLAPKAIKEFSLEEGLSNNEPQECGFGLLRSGVVQLRESGFIVHRDPVSRRPITIYSV